jgi:tetratricopeptide (TPR) repeat protein
MKMFLLLAATVIAAGCTTTAPLPPVVTPEGNDRYLVDPRLGTETALPPAQATRFEAAWRHILANNESEARLALDDVRRKHPDYLPVLVADAALALRGARYDEASDLVARVLAIDPESIPARVYEAEIAVRQNRTRVAYDLYRALAAMPEAPAFARERVTELEGILFNELLAAAETAPDAESVRLLREALTFNASAIEPRITLSQRLLRMKQYDEARREIDPVLNTAADRPEVQELLAEVEVGRGRFQEAIVRYDRLARRTREPRYAARLEEIKQEWSAANMPEHYRSALQSSAITRADLAILLYWTVPSIRFAQNLSSPPIAIDIEVAGREEIIRAIALGLFDVDPVTRRVNPARPVSAARFSTLLSRVLTLRAAPCARGVSSDKVLATCGVTDPLASANGDTSVTGHEAQRAFQQLANALK